MPFYPNGGFDPGAPPPGPGGILDEKTRMLERDRLLREGKPIPPELRNEDDVRRAQIEASKVSSLAAPSSGGSYTATAYMPGAGNFWLGGDPNFARDLSAQYRQQGLNLIQSGANAQGRAPAEMDWLAANKNYWTQGNARARSGEIQNDLRSLANARRIGPSAAEEQLRSGAEQNANLALSASQVGGGNIATARNAAFSAMRARNASAQQIDALRAQQQASDSSFRSQALGQVGQMQNQSLGQDLAERQQDIGFWQQQAQLQAQGRAQNDAMSLGLGNLGIGSQQQAAGVNIEQLGALGQLEGLRERSWTQNELANVGALQADRAAIYGAIGSGVNSLANLYEVGQRKNSGGGGGGGFSGGTPNASVPAPNAVGGGFSAPTQTTASSQAQALVGDDPTRSLGGYSADGPPPLPQAGDLAEQRAKDGAYARSYRENPANFWLGGTPEFAREQADALRGQGGDFFGSAADVQGRAAPQIHGGAPERTMGLIGQSVDGVNDATSQLRALARQEQGPSAAQAQLQGAQQLNASNAIAAAAAQGGSTAGNYAAGQLGMAQGGAINAQAAGARAGEFDQFRRQQAGNLAQASALQQQLRQSGLNQRAQDFAFQYGNAALRNQNAASNDRFSLGLGALGLQSQQLAGTLDAAQLRALMQQEALRTNTRSQTSIANLNAYQRERAAQLGLISALAAGTATVAGTVFGGPAVGAVAGKATGGIIKAAGGGYSGPAQSDPYNGRFYG